MEKGIKIIYQYCSFNGYYGSNLNSNYTYSKEKLTEIEKELPKGYEFFYKELEIYPEGRFNK